jgi:glycosyltransferase involved in cell wall biosynthesis
MKITKVAIVGTMGVPASYGGFETLAENLIINQPEFIDYTVFASSKHYKVKPANYLGAKINYLPFNANGIQSIIYDFISLIIASRSSHVILLLGVSGAIALPIFTFFFPKVKIITNIDGIEWKRKKWNKMAKNFLKLSEKFAIKNSHHIITDNKGIEDYVKDNYDFKSETIAYGANEIIEPLILKNYKFLKIKKNEYAFKVARIEPENNLEMILDAFIDVPLDIVIVGNWLSSAFGKKMFKNYSNYSNINLLYPIYDINLLNELRSNCKIYIHGHSAGGTNPSLVEAMALKLPVISFDVNFNRYTLKNNGIFFKSSDDLKLIIKNISEYDIDIIGSNNFNNFKTNYKWNVIVNKYVNLFLN